MALEKLRKELEDLNKNPLTYCKAGPVSPRDIIKWEATINGPPESPYSGGVFRLKINFDWEYPNSPPKVVFDTKVRHPNMDNNGTIKLDILKEQHWNSGLGVSEVLLSIYSLLKNPNPDDPAVPGIANTYKTDIESYKDTAKKLTEKYAK